LYTVKGIEENFVASTGWKQGYDGTFKAVIGKYNKRAKYLTNVFRYSRNYLPTR